MQRPQALRMGHGEEVGSGWPSALPGTRPPNQPPFSSSFAPDAQTRLNSPRSVKALGGGGGESEEREELSCPSHSLLPHFLVPGASSSATPASSQVSGGKGGLQTRSGGYGWFGEGKDEKPTAQKGDSRLMGTCQRASFPCCSG